MCTSVSPLSRLPLSLVLSPSLSFDLSLSFECSLGICHDLLNLCAMYRFLSILGRVGMSDIFRSYSLAMPLLLFRQIAIHFIFSSVPIASTRSYVYFNVFRLNNFAPSLFNGKIARIWITYTFFSTYICHIIIIIIMCTVWIFFRLYFSIIFFR